MENSEVKPPRKKTLPLILGLVLLTGAIFGTIRYIYSLHHEVTDDAQIDGDISPVLARVAGYVEQINFEENQYVNKGDTLIILDERDLRIKVNQAQAAVENAEAGIDVAKANTASASANYQTAKAAVETARIHVWKATQEFNRYQNLMNDSITSKQQYESVKAEKESAEAQLNVAIGQEHAASVMISAAEKQIAVVHSIVNQKKADLDYTLLQLSYSKIISPADGIASRKNVQLGQLVNAGSPLFSIVSNAAVYITANFKETQLEKMKKDDDVEITIDAYPDLKLQGKIYAFAPATGARFSLLPPDNATGNFVKVVQRIPVKIVIINNQKEIIEKLHPGMSVKVAVTLE